MDIKEIRDCNDRLVCKVDVLSGTAECRYKDSTMQIVLSYNIPALFKRGSVITKVTRRKDNSLSVESFVEKLSA